MDSTVDAKLAPSAVTIAIEWENPRDVDVERTDRAMRALAEELDRHPAPEGERHRLLYLYDRQTVREEEIRGAVDRVAPELFASVSVEFVDTAGLTYYQLKSHAATLAETDLLLVLDSDVEPQPGWLPGLIRPFADADVMVVGGVTFLSCFDLVSRTMALIWIFDLPSELERSAARKTIHANNFAVRTDFFRENPFPDTPAFKKQCGIWMDDNHARGIGFVRTPEAQTLHAPHSGLPFVVWRAARSGLDRDAKAAMQGKPRVSRILRPFRFGAKRFVRSASRIVGKGAEVDLPARQIPAAIGVAFVYYSILSLSQIASAITRSGSAPALPEASLDSSN